MLRITKTAEAGSTILRVEGKLVPPWVEELATCCSQAAPGPDTLVVDLRSVTFVSSEGKKLLGCIYRQGARLLTAGTLISGIIEEIKRQSDQDEDCNHG